MRLSSFAAFSSSLQHLCYSSPPLPPSFSPADWLEAGLLKPWAILDWGWRGADLYIHDNLHLSAKALLSDANSERSVRGYTGNDTLPLFPGTGGNAENDSAICTERKVNLPRQFAETDHASQPNAALTLMASITAAERRALWSHSYELCGWCFQVSPPLSRSLALSPLYLLCQYAARMHHWQTLPHSAPRKTQSLKNKYIMPIAVKQVGVVAVWAFKLTQTDSYFCPLTECIYSKPQSTLWIPGIDFLILKLNEL